MCLPPFLFTVTVSKTKHHLGRSEQNLFLSTLSLFLARRDPHPNDGECGERGSGVDEAAPRLGRVSGDGGWDPSSARTKLGGGGEGKILSDRYRDRTLKERRKKDPPRSSLNLVCRIGGIRWQPLPDEFLTRIEGTVLLGRGAQ